MTSNQTITRPMLAGTIKDLGTTDLMYPLFASPKIDGIRCVTHPLLGPVSRQFKPIPNVHIRHELANMDIMYSDGELVTLDPQGKYDDFNTIQSKVMSHHGTPIFEYLVFDNFLEPEAPYTKRLLYVEVRNRDMCPFYRVVEQMIIDTPMHLVEYEEKCLEQGYEGIITRLPSSPYKSGRSTLKQQWLLKLKRWEDAEGTIIGFEPLMRNMNEQEQNILGLSERKHRKAGLQEDSLLGFLILETQWGTLRVGSGFDMSMRQEIWEHQNEYQGHIVTFKYQKHGMKELPRFPIFKGFRPELEEG